MLLLYVSTLNTEEYVCMCVCIFTLIFRLVVDLSIISICETESDFRNRPVNEMSVNYVSQPHTSQILKNCLKMCSGRYVVKFHQAVLERGWLALLIVLLLTNFRCKFGTAK